MKRIIALLAVICIATITIAQSDSISKDAASTDTTGRVSTQNDPAITDTIKPPAPKTDSTVYRNDTIRIGGIIIIRSGRTRNGDNKETTVYHRRHRKHQKYTPPNVATNWWIVDLGISQVSDQTDYAQAIASGYLPTGANEDWFNQRSFKSTNVNIWVVMLRLNMIQQVINLKYGIGVELNNYKYTENIQYQKTVNPLVIMDNVDYRKNKLAADYITFPIMLNFNFTPDRKSGFAFSAGISAGYLYSSRQKISVGEGGSGKEKFRDDYDLRPFKISYIGELSVGPIRLYGSYATKSMFKSALDQTPFNFGVRLSHL